MLLSTLLAQSSALSSILNVPADINALDAAHIVGTSHKLLTNAIETAAQIDMEDPKAFLGNAFRLAHDATTHVNLDTSKDFLGNAFKNVKDAAANIDLEASKQNFENVFNGAKDAVANIDMEASKQALEQAFKNAQHAAANVNLENSKEVLENALKTAREADYMTMAAQINPENIQHAAEQARDWIEKNPKQAACIGISAAIFVAPVLVSSPALAVAGFGADGVVGSSIAAAVHSGIGNVAAGSAFSILQSAGASGAGLAVVNGVVQGTAFTAGAATAANVFLTEEGKKTESKL